MRLIVACSRVTLRSRRSLARIKLPNARPSNEPRRREVARNVCTDAACCVSLSRPLVSQVDRSVIDQYSKQCQSGNAVCSKNPDTAAFPLRSRRSRTGCSGRGITKGLICHADLRCQNIDGARATSTPHCPPGRVDSANVTTHFRSRSREMPEGCKIRINF